MEQLIFIGIILLFSVLEGLARKKREGGAGDDVTLPPAVPQARVRRAPEQRLPSYDHDPTFDDAADAGSMGSTEGLIPADVWEEIQALARGGPVAPVAPRAVAVPPAAAPPPAPTPVQAGFRPMPPPEVDAPARSRPMPLPEVDVPQGPEHAVHLTHAKYGKPVRERLTAFDDHSRRARSPMTDGLRSVLRGGGAGLRQAVLLHEILGPPVALKDEPSER